MWYSFISASQCYWTCVWDIEWIDMFGLAVSLHILWIWPVSPSSIFNSYLLCVSSQVGRVWATEWDGGLLWNTEITMQQKVFELSLTQLQPKLCVSEHTRSRVGWRWAAAKSQPGQNQCLQQPCGKTLSPSVSQLPLGRRWLTSLTSHI